MTYDMYECYKYEVLQNGFDVFLTNILVHVPVRFTSMLLYSVYYCFHSVTSVFLSILFAIITHGKHVCFLGYMYLVCHSVGAFSIYIPLVIYMIYYIYMFTANCACTGTCTVYVVSSYSLLYAKYFLIAEILYFYILCFDLFWIKQSRITSELSSRAFSIFYRIILWCVRKIVLPDMLGALSVADIYSVDTDKIILISWIVFLVILSGWYLIINSISFYGKQKLLTYYVLRTILGSQNMNYDFLLIIIIMLIFLAGDIHLNPVPFSASRDVSVCHVHFRSLSEDKLRHNYLCRSGT